MWWKGSGWCLQILRHLDVWIWETKLAGETLRIEDFEDETHQLESARRVTSTISS